MGRTPDRYSRARLKRWSLAAGLLLAAAVGGRLWVERSRREGGLPSANPSRAAARARAHPNDLQAQLDWGAALQGAGRAREAMLVYSHAAQLAPRDPRPYTCLGTLAMADHRPDVAAVNFREATRWAPQDADLWRALAEAAAQARAFREAVAAWDQVVRLAPNDAVAWKRLGILATRTRLLSRGHEALLHAVALNPRDFEAQEELGDCALTMSLLPEAQHALETVLAGRPDDAHALAALALVTLQQDPSPGGLTKARELVDRALSLKSYAAAYMIRGQILLRQKLYAPAIADFTAARAADPTSAGSLVYLSQAYAAAGQPELARKAAAEYQAARSKSISVRAAAGDRRAGR